MKLKKEKENIIRQNIQFNLLKYGDKIGNSTKKSLEDLIIGTLYDSDFSLRVMSEIFFDIINDINTIDIIK
jgi:hypothetical protein